MQTQPGNPTFSASLLRWYSRHKRDLPWRGTRDPYVVWLSEIILQQTRVIQGVPYFLKFLEHYPRVRMLAAAPEEEVLKLWQGLGYYSRARNLLRTARKVAFELNGRFPDSYRGLLELPGVGPYTAAAIASICHGLPHPVVDGNVYRVLSRYYNVDLPMDTGPGRKHFDALAHASMDAGRIATYNQAIMEFGAIQCVPKNPDCRNCPLEPGCGARAAGVVGERPVKKGKTLVRKRYFHYIMPVDGNLRTCLLRREGPGIWQGLYEFPLLEQRNGPDMRQVSGLLSEKLMIPVDALNDLVRFNEVPRVHKLSHQHLVTTFWIATVKQLPGDAVPFADAEQFPVPVLISEFIETVKNSYF